MASLRYLPTALEDLGRLAKFLRETQPIEAARTVSLLVEGINVLGKHPLIGRPIDEERRELVVFRGRSGYIVQYAYRVAADEVLLLAIRHQRELDG